MNDWKADVIKAIAGSKTISGGGSFFEDGRYLLEVKKLVLQKGYKGESFVAEFVVKESHQKEDGVHPAPVGAERSCVFMLSGGSGAKGASEMAKHNVKSLALALAKTTEAQLAA